MSDRTGRPKEKRGHKRHNISFDRFISEALEKVGNKSQFLEKVARPVLEKLDPGEASVFLWQIDKDIIQGINEATQKRDFKQVSALSWLADCLDDARKLCGPPPPNVKDEEKTKPKDDGKGLIMSVKPAGPKATYFPEVSEFPRGIWELAAWIKREPTNWAEGDSDIKKAKLGLEDSPYLVPEIREPHEDPDSYVFVWPPEAVKELSLQGRISSRFFGLKQVYNAVIADIGEEILEMAPVFVGACCTPVIVDLDDIYGHDMQPLRYVGRPIGYQPIKDSRSTCVAVCKEAEGSIRVVHVEIRWGKLDKAWISGIARQLKAKKAHGIDWDSLKDDECRRMLLNLRALLEKGKLVFSSKHVNLLDDLREYSYGKYSEGYVLALAIAVDLCFS